MLVCLEHGFLELIEVTFYEKFTVKPKIFKDKNFIVSQILLERNCLRKKLWITCLVSE